jgi:crotonobetainyl-CoA:carnitine CoA-transferase CaiB-like acyl-CoA transferase
MTDIATGLYAHGAIMAALMQRQQTGKGQKINCDLLSTQVSNQSHDFHIMTCMHDQKNKTENPYSPYPRALY